MLTKKNRKRWLSKSHNYNVETISNGSFNFFTTALNHKEALYRLFTESSDFKNIVNDNQDLTIKIKKI
jgi:hypothetical protein